MLAGFASVGHAQASSAGLEVVPRVGALWHELVGHEAAHATFGLQVVGQSGHERVRFGLVADAWLDGIDLGPALDDRSVNATYLLYALGIEVGDPRLFLSLGLGAETVRFGERYEAASFLPESSTGIQGSFGFGSRIPLGGAASAWALRLEARTHVVHQEIFDPLGVRRGREGNWIPAASVGVAYRLR